MAFANGLLKMDKQPKGTILSGYRVLDLADGKGLLCLKLLTDMGADVIRIESPGTKSNSDFLNAGKRSISLNLETRRGQQIFKRLIKTADVMVESYPPGFLETLGLGYSELSKTNPRLIMASITNFGQSGPYRDYKSCDLVASALGGQMYVCGEPETPPLKPFGNQSYYSASLFAAIGIMLALWNRHTAGKGQHIDISLEACVAVALDHVLVRYFYEGVVSKRQGSLHWNNAFRSFPCRDGYILLSLFQQWETLVEWLDSEGVAGDLTDKKWLNRETRLQNLDYIIEVLERWTRSRNVEELVEKGQLMRFPWAEVNSIPRLVNNPQLKERHFFIDTEDPESGKKYKYPGVPCKLSRSPWQVSTGVPELGEHNSEIYQGELGISEADLYLLAKDGII